LPDAGQGARLDPAGELAEDLAGDAGAHIIRFWRVGLGVFCGMGWVRRWGLMLAGAAVIAAAIGWAGWVYSLPTEQRNSASGEGQFWLALVGFVLLILGGLAKRWPRAEVRPVADLADMLTREVRGRWERAAAQRRLTTPAPIPVRWSQSPHRVGGPVNAAVADGGQRPAFPPLPGVVAATERFLRAGGGQPELHALYGGLASGRLIIEGPPGSGKSGAGILLVLDALIHRDELAEQQRAQVPVPVILTMSGWQAATVSVEDWLADRLAKTIPFLAGRRGRSEAAALVDAGAVAVILDGLDEIPESRRPTVLENLSCARIRIVLLTRTAELAITAQHRYLTGAAVVHLDAIPASTAADYLERCLPGPIPHGWRRLVDRLRQHPEGPLARGLASPLALSLLRDTYHPDDDVAALLDPAVTTGAHTLEDHLLDRVIPSAYTARVGQPQPPYSVACARAALTFLAIRMTTDHTRDLAWWRIPRWAPAAPRIILTGLLYGLLIGISAGLATASKTGMIAGGIVIGLVVGLSTGWGFGIVCEDWAPEDYDTTRGTPRAAWRNDQRDGLWWGVVGMMIGAGVAAVLGIVFGIMFGLGVLVVFGLLFAVLYPGTLPQRLAFVQLRLRYGLPLRLMRFLDDAYERGVLRTVGAVYQFRHARLQDRLAIAVATSTGSDEPANPPHPGTQ
jgi:hypothetical protein